jgi:hypothetical protein
MAVVHVLNPAIETRVSRRRPSVSAKWPNRTAPSGRPISVAANVV